MEGKCCSMCGEVKPLADFTRRQAKCRPCHAVYNKQYRDAHRAKMNEYSNKYISSEKGKATQKRYRETQKGRDAARMKEHRRRANLASNGVYEITDKDMRHLLAQPCAHCGAEGQHIDHIIPIKRGGRHSIGNLQMLCQRCNSSKHKKTMTEWRAFLLAAA